MCKDGFYCPFWFSYYMFLLLSVTVSAFISQFFLCMRKRHYRPRLYKEPSIISRIGAAIWSKTMFWPTGHRHP
jgi:hypothetical protein